MIKLIIMLICGALFSWGGHSWNVARRYFIPVLLTVSCFFITHSLWCFTMLFCIGALCMGYGEDAPFTHIFGPAWGRGVWGIIVALCLSLALLLTGHISILNFIGYLIIGFFFEPCFKNIPQIIGDIIIGCGFGLIIFLIH